MSTAIWQTISGYQDILYHKCEEGIAKITINRPTSVMHFVRKPCAR